MRRRAVEDLVLGQPTVTTTSRAQRQLCGNAAYSHSRPQTDGRQGPLCGTSPEPQALQTGELAVNISRFLVK